MKLAIIDIGSNSIRMILVRMVDGCYKIYNDLKESARLGEGLETTGQLGEEHMDRALSTLKMFKRLIDAVGCDTIIAVATEAVRKASNKEIFLEAVRKKVGIDVRVLSGEEEAFFDFLAVKNSLPVSDALIMDIGGSSTELVYMQDKKMVEKVSLPLGSINLAERFDLSTELKPEQETALKHFLFHQFSKINWLATCTAPVLVGIGGTIRSLGKIDRARKNYPLDITHYYQMDPHDVQEIYQTVKRQSLVKRQKIKGLSKSRADLFLGPVAALSVITELCGIEEIVISGSGLREGLIFDHLARQEKIIRDPLDYSIRNIAGNHNLNEKHGQRVYHLFRSLFDQLKPLHHLGPEYGNILKTAALLHDCGININYYGHPLHSFYMILHSGIQGLTHRELLISAYIAGSHRKDECKVDLSRYQQLLSSQDALIIRTLGVLLSMAESLDRNMSSTVQDVSCRMEDHTVTIKTMATETPYLEINDAMQFKNIFAKVFGRDLRII
ncbi:exopolyphosphatase [Candidatus Formimonas warabiya]|uniref:Exopolyphosphatase n=1 Tax=Formimonas warabiya TaxID=1761012 RepID=A0A3G1KV70_FORW1|nr:exopolyphosphatase [Candidatus Formimonas warabiya]ATW26300.1 exopolyphosphatase [Candidatus Formimonas warabiya]